MIENTQIAGDNFIFKNSTWWNIDSITMIGNNDDRTLEWTENQYWIYSVCLNIHEGKHPCRRWHHPIRSDYRVRDNREYFENVLENLWPAQREKWRWGRSRKTNGTLVKLSPSFTNGTVGNDRWEFMTRLPRLSVNRLDMTSKRSDVVFTGKNRRRGTLMPIKFKLSEYFLH